MKTKEIQTKNGYRFVIKKNNIGEGADLRDATTEVIVEGVGKQKIIAKLGKMKIYTLAYGIVRCDELNITASMPIEDKVNRIRKMEDDDLVNELFGIISKFNNNELTEDVKKKSDSSLKEKPSPIQSP